MGEKKYKWFKIGETGEKVVEDREIRIMEVNNKKLCLTSWQGNYQAFAYKCPHAGGILADGELDQAGNIICPNHRYKYNIKNGYNVSGEGYFMNVYPVETRPDGIYIGFADTSIWDIFRS